MLRRNVVACGTVCLLVTGLAAAQTPARPPAGPGKAAADVVHVRAYGAVGDGAADDSTAVAAAAAAVAEGGTLYFGSGSFKFSEIRLTRSIVIDGGGATFESPPLASAGGYISSRLFYCETADAVGSITVKNATLDGNGTARNFASTSRKALLRFESVGTVTLRDLVVHHHAPGGRGLPAALADRDSQAISIYRAGRVIVDNLEMHHNYDEQLFVYGDPDEPTWVDIRRSYWHDSDQGSDWGYTPISTVHCRGIVSGNLITGTKTSAMNLLGSADMDVSDNVIDDCESVAIDLVEDGYFHAERVTIRGNRMNAVEYGIAAHGNDLMIEDNHIAATGSYGILANARHAAGYTSGPRECRNLTIRNNTIADVAQATGGGETDGTAIYAGNINAGFALSNVVIEGNRISQPGGNATRTLKYGIYLWNVRGGIIRQNDIRDYTRSAIAGQGAVEDLIIGENTFDSSDYGSNRSHDVIVGLGGSSLNVQMIRNIFAHPPHAGGLVHHVYLAGTSPGRPCGLINNRGLINYAYSSTADHQAYVKDDWGLYAAMPTTGTYQANDTIYKTAVSGGVQGWRVIEAGTMGTLNGGSTTGTISLLTPTTMSVSSAIGLSEGVWITVAGAGAGGSDLKTFVVRVSGTVVTVWRPAATAVTDAAVAYAQPTLKEFGKIH